MVLSVNSALGLEKERQLRAMHSGLVQSGAPVNTNFNVSNSDAKNAALESVNNVSFGDMLKNSVHALDDNAAFGVNGNHHKKDESLALNNVIAATGDATTVRDNNMLEAGVTRISENNEKEMEILNSTPQERDAADDLLTDEDRAYLDNIDVPDDLKENLRLSIALDRKNGTLTGPIDAHYLYGQNGLLTRMGSMMQNFVLEGKDTDTLLDVMQNLKKLNSNLLEGLSYMNQVDAASRRDKSINIYNADSQMAQVDLSSRIRMEASHNLMQNWVENYYKDLADNESFLGKLENTQERPNTKGGLPVDHDVSGNQFASSTDKDTQDEAVGTDETEVEEKDETSSVAAAATTIRTLQTGPISMLNSGMGS